MAKVKEYDIEEMEELYDLGKALASPVRLEMLKLLYDKSLIIGEIAKRDESSGFQYSVPSEDYGKGRTDPYGRTAGDPAAPQNCVPGRWISCILIW